MSWLSFRGWKKNCPRINITKKVFECVSIIAKFLIYGYTLTPVFYSTKQWTINVTVDIDDNLRQGSSKLWQLQTHSIHVKTFNPRSREKNGNILKKYIVCFTVKKTYTKRHVKIIISWMGRKLSTDKYETHFFWVYIRDWKKHNNHG